MGLIYIFFRRACDQHQPPISLLTKSASKKENKKLKVGKICINCLIRPISIKSKVFQASHQCKNILAAAQGVYTKKVHKQKYKSAPFQFTASRVLIIDLLVVVVGSRMCGSQPFFVGLILKW